MLPGQCMVTSTPWCVVRKQEDSYLVYNSKTDELHLIPPLGFYIYQLCDGLRTVSEIRQLLGIGIDTNPTSVKNTLDDFIDQLVQRGILEIENHD